MVRSVVVCSFSVQRPESLLVNRKAFSFSFQNPQVRGKVSFSLGQRPKNRQAKRKLFLFHVSIRRFVL